MKKKVLILTLNDYIIYQPTILNLYDHLLPHFDVTVVSFKPAAGNKTKDETRNVIYLKTNFFLRQFFQKTDFICSKIFKGIKKIFPKAEYHYTYYNKYLPYLLRRHVKKHPVEDALIIVTDFPALFSVQDLYETVHFLSLEIENNSNPIHQKVDRSKVRSVFIQSEERYNYLFPGLKIPTFYIQNAPVFSNDNIRNFERKDFIWSGAMDRRLAIFDCLDFFDAYPQYKLVMKGAAERKVLNGINKYYIHLIKEGRIRIDREYLPASAFLDFLSHFRYGFAFYSWELISQSFNYATAPSGKLFMNLAAGVPVIACDIPGFKLVKDFNAGVLISDYKPETIHAAMLQIEEHYELYSQGCYKAAEYYSFDKRVATYIDFLLKEASTSSDT